MSRAAIDQVNKAREAVLAARPELAFRVQASKRPDFNHVLATQAEAVVAQYVLAVILADMDFSIRELKSQE